jgi:hypothetical protein
MSSTLRKFETGAGADQRHASRGVHCGRDYSRVAVRFDLPQQQRGARRAEGYAVSEERRELLLRSAHQKRDGCLHRECGEQLEEALKTIEILREDVTMAEKRFDEAYSALGSFQRQYIKHKDQIALLEKERDEIKELNAKLSAELDKHNV